MNCREIDEFAPLYLSGEMDEGQRAQFREHLAQCRSCAAEIDRQIALDGTLRDAISSELPDAVAVQDSVRGRIATERHRRFAGVAGVAAMLAFAAVFGYRALRPEPAAPLYADAALDHRLEVIEHQPRRWRTDPAEIEKLAARYELSNVAALAPEGYRLEHAKMCGIDGKPALHLVYTNGSQEVSLFVRSKTGSDRGLHAAQAGSLHVASFQNDRIEIIATGGSSDECLQFAQFAARVL
jgi:anti-sigma factor RsiW